MRDKVTDFVIAFGVGRTLFLSLGAFVATSMGIVAFSTYFNGCVDARVMIAVEPRIRPVADMVEFTMKKQGYWQEYQDHLRAQGRYC